MIVIEDYEATLMPLNYTFKNGQNGKFYAMYI